MRLALAASLFLAASLHLACSVHGGEPIVGVTTRDAVEASPLWSEAVVDSRPDPALARELGRVPPGATIDVYFGTWCSDSRREVGRLFRALDRVPAPWPFTIRWIAVDHAKWAPGLPRGIDLRFVPTLVVRRDGREVGRIVESAPRGVERELVELLRGEAHGVIGGRAGRGG